jgi:hypothetical protein
VNHASATPTIVITGLDPVIHVLLANVEIKPWMAGSSPAMTIYN